MRWKPPSAATPSRRQQPSVLASASKSNACCWPAMTPLAGNQPLVDAIQKHAQGRDRRARARRGHTACTPMRLYVERGISWRDLRRGPRTVLESHAKRADERLQLEDLRRATKVIARALRDLLV